jgi:predicted Zn-dependent protease
MIVEGAYFDGYKPVGLPILFSVHGEESTLTGAGMIRTYRTSLLTVTPRIGSAGRFIYFPDGGQLLCADNQCLDLLASDSPTEGPVAWLEERVGVAIGCVVLIVVLLLCVYAFGLPAAADWTVTKVSMETEHSLGLDALFWLDNKKWFQPTELDNAEQVRISHIFSTLVSGSKMAPNYRLEFRLSKSMGANALALPGGIIVITDEMVSLAGSEDEIAAVLAHEIGHAELRHAMKQATQSSAVAAVAAVVTSDASSFTVAVAGLPALLANTKYSREFETEADEFAFKLLKQHGISPAAFASLMERLSTDHEEEEKAISFLSTHPVTADRIKRARELSAEKKGDHPSDAGTEMIKLDETDEEGWGLKK